MKKCNKCGELKTLESFYADKRNKDGKQGRCINCKNAYSREYLRREDVVARRMKKRKGHGMSYTRLYKVWTAMLQRCNNSNFIQYDDYGGRGITVCPEWADFRTFFDWAMAVGYSENLTIERLNNDGNYCPENCIFVTRMVQAQNTRFNINVEVDGEVLSLSATGRKYNLDLGTLKHRYHKLGLRGEALVKPTYHYHFKENKLEKSGCNSACPVAQGG